MRTVDPFDYWRGHSSAIAGLGGLERSPDPRYVFHTRYHDVRPGRARFVLRMGDVRASFGELSIRVHAWKPESDTNIALVSGTRLLLDGEQGADFTLPVHFASQKGVRYALYGYISEESDITAQTLEVSIDEAGDPALALPQPTVSVLALDRLSEETRPANALLHYGRVDIERPVSQSCTIGQLAALGLSTREVRGEKGSSSIASWSETLCLAALNAYGIGSAQLEGLVVGPVSPGLAPALADAALTMSEERSPPPRDSDAFFDFLVMPAAFNASDARPPNATGRWDAITGWAARLKIGGLAMIGLRYRPDSDLVSSSGQTDTTTPTRNEIGQWVLRLISDGYSIAPLAFAPLSELVLDQQGLAGFVLIIQRS